MTRLIQMTRALSLGLLFAAHMAMALPDLTINVNTASAEEIADVLTGVGLTRAEAIVAHREKYGEFTDVEQLMAVRGIGEVVLANNRDRILLTE